jgi:hypothetical protein
MNIVTATSRFCGDAFADLIPAENRTTAKEGFQSAAWVRGCGTRFDRYFDRATAARLRASVRGSSTMTTIARLREEHRRGERDNSYELFAILIFDTWYRKYMTRTLPMRRFPDIL